MRKTAWISAALLCAGAVTVGCGGDPMPPIMIDAQMVDAGPPPGDSGPADGGRQDAGRCALVPGRAPGAACATGDRCDIDRGLTCATENVGQIPSMATVAVLPDGGITQGRPFPYRGFSGGFCYDACDLNAAEDECGDCATCTDRGPQAEVNFGAGGFFPEELMIDAICRTDCTPSTTGNGGCREGYTCDVWSGTCVDACLAAEGTLADNCEFSIGDPDGNGQGDIVDNGAGSGATCNVTTGRCDIPGTDGAVAGGPCEENTDCEDNGFCLGFDEDPDGYCSRIGCLWPGFECDGADEVCDVRAFGSGISACLEGCTVGAEDTVTERRGVGGGNPTCDGDGYACFWNGNSSSTDTLNGSCLPGNYNDTPAYNVGEECLSDSDCFSPFGYGRCLFLGTATDRVQSGICVIGGCAGGTGGVALGILGGDDAPVAIPTDVQAELCDVGGGDLCVGFGGGATFCVESCTSADQCAPGYACPELLSDGTRLCWPNCTADADCRSGTACRNTTGGSCGANQECYCADAMPAPDGGTPTDGGTPAADAGTPATDAGGDGGTGTP